MIDEIDTKFGLWVMTQRLKKNINFKDIEGIAIRRWHDIEAGWGLSVLPKEVTLIAANLGETVEMVTKKALGE